VTRHHVGEIDAVTNAYFDNTHEFLSLGLDSDVGSMELDVSENITSYFPTVLLE
jgi:hypothetical protein